MMIPSTTLVCLLLVIGNSVASASPNPLDIKFIDFVNPILDKTLALLIGQPESNKNGSKVEFRDYLLEDESNEDLPLESTAQHIIERARFGHETYEVVSDDGYITQIVRIINPLADRTKLRKPPVAFVHGGTINPVTWIWASIIQHHPEKWPRSVEEDGPITSWNRSLAFTLANNGYDVYLLSIRGSNEQNQGHVKFRTSRRKGNNMMLTELDRLKYWKYSLDEVVEFELPRQLDKVLEISGAEKVSIVTISIGHQVVLSLAASNQEYAKKIHTFVTMGPPVTLKDSNRVFKSICMSENFTPYMMGTILTSEVILSRLVRNAIAIMNSSKRLRYSLWWAMSNCAMGPSATFQTNYELPVYNHMLQPTGYRYVNHFCQQFSSGKLQKYDYGPRENLKRYKSLKPPVREYSNIHLDNWLIVSGNNDMIGTKKSVEILLNEIRPKAKHLLAPNFNHLDFVSGVENDIYVNLPVLKYLNQFHHVPKVIFTTKTILQPTRIFLEPAKGITKLQRVGTLLPVQSDLITDSLLADDRNNLQFDV